jgi:hypothetical protein
VGVWGEPAALSGTDDVVAKVVPDTPPFARRSLAHGEPTPRESALSEGTESKGNFTRSRTLQRSGEASSSGR